MDTSDKEKFEPGNRNENAMDYCPPSSLTSNWQFGGVDVTNSSMGLIPVDSQIPVCRDLVSDSSCASASMIDSFGPALWDHSYGLKNLGVCDINAHNTVSSSNTIGFREGGLNSSRNVANSTMDMGWNSPNAMLGGGIFLPNATGMMQQSLSQLPADPEFIARAAKFSCFSSGSFTDMVNPFGLHESMGLYSRSGGMTQAHKNTVNVGEASRGVQLSVDQRLNEGSPLKNERESECHVRSRDEADQVLVGSHNESDEVNSSGGASVAPEDDPSNLDRKNGDISAKNNSSKKRKREGQDKELEQDKETQKSGEATKENPEIKQKGDHNLTSTTNKTGGKQSKQGSQASDAPKEEYIHVRARRGQATNSHSLAERVRREKISERMKFLQDLVPGCSKVTGKAVMLDEIINYVQSLQRQVEFLSMKLATVNPRLDLNIEGLLAKDMLHSRGLPSTSLAFSQELPMGLPLLHPSQPSLVQPAFLGVDSHSDVLPRTNHPHLTPITGGFKEPAQVPSAWHDELHNLVQMTYGATPPQDIQDENGQPLPLGHMKVEP